jgi:hypothetical protein
MLCFFPKQFSKMIPCFFNVDERTNMGHVHLMSRLLDDEQGEGIELIIQHLS